LPTGCCFYDRSEAAAHRIGPSRAPVTSSCDGPAERKFFLFFTKFVIFYLRYFITARFILKCSAGRAVRLIQHHSSMEGTTMKKTAGFVILFLLALAPVFAGDQDFTLINDTGLTIDQLYCSPTATKDWEEDVLGVDVLKDGEKVEIKFSRDEKAAEWDLMIVDGEGDKIYWTEINLLEAETITLYYKDGKPTAEIKNADEESDDSAEQGDVEEDNDGE
jgi:hypothetical protein